MKVNNSKNDQNIFYEAISLLEDICSKEQLEKLKKIQNLCLIISDLNKSGGLELVKEFLNLDLESLQSKDIKKIKTMIYRANESLEKDDNILEDELESKHKTNINIDSTEQVSKNNAIVNQNQI